MRTISPTSSDEAATAHSQADADAVIHEFDGLGLTEFLAIASAFGHHRFGYVVTPNVDHMLRFREDAEFRRVCRSADFSLLDSRLAALLLRVTRGLSIPVCTGADLTRQLFDEVIERDDRVVVIGSPADEIAKFAQHHGLSNLKHLNPPMGFIRDKTAVDAALEFIERSSPFRFCFLAVGSPQQELLAHELQLRGRARGLVLCVGAALNFLTGREDRAPLWMRHAGLEWLHRLCQDPRRLAHRYLVRGPRILTYLPRARIALRNSALAVAT